MTNEQTLLRDDTFMQAFLDTVIPPSDDGRMPGAGSLGLSAELADALEADERLSLAVGAALRAVQDAALERDPGGLPALSLGSRLELVESHLMEHPALNGVTRHLYLAYYQHPAVLEGLGEPPRPPFPGGFEVDETDTELLEKLRARARS